MATAGPPEVSVTTRLLRIKPLGAHSADVPIRNRWIDWRKSDGKLCRVLGRSVAVGKLRLAPIADLNPHFDPGSPMATGLDDTNMHQQTRTF
jgi:hypothetical protein